MVFSSPSSQRLVRRTPRGYHATHLTTWLGCLITLSLLLVTTPASAKDKGKEADKKEQKDSKSKEKEEEKEPEETDEENTDDSSEESSGSAEASLSSADIDSSDDGPGLQGMGNTIIFFEGGVRSDNGTLLQREAVGRLEEEENTDVKSLGPMFHFGVLTKLFWQLRLGVAFGYGFNYTLKERQTKIEKEQEQEQQVWVLGQLQTVDARLEFSQRLGDGFYVLAAPRGGLSMISVGEDLKALTNELEGSHAVRQGPRLGLLLGGDVGVRYLFRPWFSLRLSGGYSYTLQSLLKATRRGDAADSDRTWRSSVARFGTNLGLEVNF